MVGIFHCHVSFRGCTETYKSILSTWKFERVSPKKGDVRASKGKNHPVIVIGYYTPEVKRLET